MTLEISLRKPFNSLQVLWAQKDDRSQQDYHWVGQKRDAGHKQGKPGGPDKEPKTTKGKKGYCPLSDITIGEVDDVYQRYEHQLLLAQENWIGKNCFCQIPLKRKHDYPSMVFGRVKTCYPSDGVLDNVEELELYFPQPDGAPNVIHIHKDDISRSSQRQVQSFFVRIRVMASAEEKAELVETESLLSTNGFYPEFESGYLDILEMTDQNQSVYPWMYVIGSRWFGSIPDSMHDEVKGKLKEMIGWGKQIFNYHPEWLPIEVNTLNRVLGYKHGFTQIVLVEPGNARETSLIVAKAFERLISIPVP